MRDRAMGRYGGTKKRAPDGQNNVKSEKWGRKSGETFEWPREKCALEKNLREEEIIEKKEGRESQREEPAALLLQLHATQVQNYAQLQYQMQQQQQNQLFAMKQQQMVAICGHNAATTTTYTCWQIFFKTSTNKLSTFY